MYQIEKGIPMPRSAENGLTVTLKDLEVGDSFVIRIDQRTGVPSVAKRVGIKVSIHKINATEARVWRIA